jgi:hypothetical protein
MPIDNIELLKETMRKSGLNTVAEGLNFNDKDIKEQIGIQIERFDKFKTLFGKKAIMLDNVSVDERNKITLKFIIDNYSDEKVKVKRYTKDYLVEDELGNKIEPTLDQLTEMYNKLNN